MIRVFKRIKELLDCPTPEPGKALGWDAQGNPANLALSAGAGDVTGPDSAVDGNLAAFDTTTGKLIKDSGAKVSDFAASGHNHAGVYDPAGTSAAHSGRTDNPHAVTAAQVGSNPLHGFVNRTSSSLSFDSTSHIFTVGTVGGFTVYINGLSHTFATSISLDLDDKTLSIGQWFIYLKNDWTLDASKTPWDILDLTVIPVATLYWDGSGVPSVPADERHSFRRNLIEHDRVHHTQGAAYRSGFTPTPTFGIAGATANDFTFAGGYINDEDIISGTAGNLTQCQIGYRAAGATSMLFDASGAAYAKLAGGIAQYDLNGTLTNIPLNDYGVYWIYYTNRVTTPVVSIVGQGSYDTVALAQAAPLPTLAGMSVAEWKLLYRVIVRRTQVAPFSRIHADTMYNLSTGPAIQAGAPTTTTAGNVTFAPTANITATNVQSAIESVSTTPRWYCAADGKWYTVSIILDSDSGLPTLDFTEFIP